MNETTRSAQDELWPPELDALVASPEHHELLLENDKVRVVRTRVPAGERTTIHTHCWAGVLHILSWSNFIRRDDQGNVLVDSRTFAKPPASISWGASLPPHTFENIGDTEFHAIAVELKDGSVDS